VEGVYDMIGGCNTEVTLHNSVSYNQGVCSNHRTSVMTRTDTLLTLPFDMWWTHVATCQIGTAQFNTSKQEVSSVLSRTILDDLWSRIRLQPVECELDCRLRSIIFMCTDHVILIDNTNPWYRLSVCRVSWTNSISGHVYEL